MRPEDLALIAERTRARFTQQELDEYRLLDRSPDREFRRMLAELDFEFFVRYYLYNHFTEPPANLHRETFREIEYILRTPGRINSITLWPRGFGKTTTVTLALPLWCICFELRKCIPIISDSLDQAKMQLNSLKFELEENERIIEDFGELVGPVWQASDIETANGVRVFAMGTGTRLRGRKFRSFRPDLIICDDIEDLEDVRSPVQREKQRQWFDRTLMRAGGPDTKVFVIGNYLHPECLLKHITNNPTFRVKEYSAVISFAERQDLWDAWRDVLTNLDDRDRVANARRFFEEHREEMMRGAVSAWPEAYPYYDLMVMLVSEGESSFFTEMQNSPVDPSRRFFKHWKYYHQEVRRDDDGTYDTWLIPDDGSPACKLSDCALFAATDPSMGQGRSADRSAIIILAVSPTRRMFVIEADVCRRHPSQIIQAQLKYCREYKIVRWAIERVQFQAFFAMVSADEARKEGVELNVVPIQQTANKDLRIQSLEADLMNGYILIRSSGQEALVYELENYVPGVRGARDDALDALEMARNLAKQWHREEYIASTTDAETYHFGALDEKQDPYAVWEEELPVDEEQGFVFPRMDVR